MADLTPEALDALEKWASAYRYVIRHEEVSPAEQIAALRARLAEAEAALAQSPTGASLTMADIRLVAAEGDLTPQAMLGAANFWIARMMRCAVRRALWEARDKCMPHNDDDDDGMDRQAKAQCADAILALANNPEAIKRIVEGRR